MSRKLLFLTAEFPFGTGETFIENELPYLEEAFDEITIVSLSPNGEQTRFVGKNTRIQRVPIVLNWKDKLVAFRWLLHVDVLREILRIISVYRLFPTRKRILTALFSWERAHQIQQQLQPCIQPDTIGYAYWTDDTALALAMLKKNNSNFKAVSRFHRWDVYFEASSIHYLPFRFYLNEYLDKQIGIAMQGVDYALQNWHVLYPDKLEVSRLGTKKQLQEFIEKTSLSKQRVVVSCSNVIPVKRVDFIFQVLNSLDDLPMKWIHFGDGSEFSALKNMVKERCKDHLQVEFRGRKPNQEVLNAYRIIQPDLFINLSDSEGVPVSIMEAFSLGIPVIATAVGGVPEIVSNHIGALVDPHATSQEVQLVIKNLLDSSLSEWNQLSQQAYEVWKSKYNAETNFRSFAQSIKEI